MPETIKNINTEDLSREDKLELEEKAIQTLMMHGLKFSVPLKIKPRTAPKYISLWNKAFPKHPKYWRDKRINKEWNVELTSMVDLNEAKPYDVYMRHFHIKPLYLGTIDFIRMLMIEIDFAESKIQDMPIEESGRLMKYIPQMSKIAAVAVLNCCSITDPFYKDVKELAKFFKDHLTVQRLFLLCQAINQMCNKAGFLGSIRLIFQLDTMTIPKANRVE